MIKKFIVCVDLGGTNLKLALIDSGYKIRDKLVLSTRSLGHKSLLIRATSGAIEELLRRNNLDKKSVLGVGVGVPGPTDASRGIVNFFPNIPGWKNVRLRDILKRKLKLEVFIDNDAKMMSLAEHRLGAARRFNDVICITLGTGVGGGIILGGKLFRGADNAAGEIGHLPINESGPRCNCGGTACLESYVGNIRILSQAKKIFGRAISLEEVDALAKKRDIRAIRLWQEVGGRLGVALAGVTNLLNLEAIVIGGGVANAGKILFDAIRGTIRKRSMSVQGKRVRVMKAHFSSDAGLFGAAVLVRENKKSA